MTTAGGVQGRGAAHLRGQLLLLTGKPVVPLNRAAAVGEAPRLQPSAQEEAGIGFEVAGAVMDCGCPESLKVTVSVVWPSLPSS
jgi:hypothetical protein